MTRREPRGVSLNPLLDVMIVLMFGFASVQASTIEENDEAAKKEQADAQAALEAARSETGRLTARMAALQADEAAAKAKAQSLQAEAERAQEDLDAARSEAKALFKKAYKGASEYRQDSVLSYLLKVNTVVEVEITGVPDPTAIGGVVNRCCFRPDPREDAWRECGTVPVDPAARKDWLTSPGGLRQALEDTKGGNALTVIRQGPGATYRIGDKLREMVRSEFGDRKVFVQESAVELPPACSAR